MRSVLMAGVAVLAALSCSLVGPAQAQGVTGSGPVPRDKPATFCDALPADAVKSVPAPFDAYMRLMCRDPLGQGLQAVEGFRWTTQDGQPIGLVATSGTGSPDANGLRHFPASWYVALSPMPLSPVEQRGLKRNLRRAIRPGLLKDAAILGLRAETSNGEKKVIVLVLPAFTPRTPAWLIGLECNGACFRQDATPLMFAGSPN